MTMSMDVCLGFASENMYPFEVKLVFVCVNLFHWQTSSGYNMFRRIMRAVYICLGGDVFLARFGLWFLQELFLLLLFGFFN